MKEILPGVWHWTAAHPKIGIDVSSFLLVPERAIVNPLPPPRGYDSLPVEPDHVLVTNRHHYRDSDEVADRFGATVWCPDPALDEVRQKHPDRSDSLRGYADGDALPGGIEAIEIGALSRDEAALLVPRVRAVLIGDGVIRDGDGPLSFVPDEYMGDDPEAVRAGLRRAYGRLLSRDFDHLLLAHGDPWLGGGKAALESFID